MQKPAPRRAPFPVDPQLHARRARCDEVITADVRAVPLKVDANSETIPATAEFDYAGTYPLARFLYMYVNYKPGSELDPLRKEFVKYVFSQEGQGNVLKDGYFPISSRIADEDLANLGLK